MTAWSTNSKVKGKNSVFGEGRKSFSSLPVLLSDQSIKESLIHCKQARGYVHVIKLIHYILGLYNSEKICAFPVRCESRHETFFPPEVSFVTLVTLVASHLKAVST